MIARAAGIVLLAGIALGTTAGEVASALALGVVASDRRLRAAAWASPWTGPIVLLAVAWLCMAARPDGHLLASLGRIWALAPLLCATVLPMPARLGTRLALPAATWCVVGALAAVIGARGLGIPEEAGAGPWDHHLSATYALLGPAVAAVWLGQRREATLLVVAVLATGSLGGVAALAVAGVATAGPPAAAMGIGATLLAPLLAPEVVGDRAMLWTAGAQLAAEGGVPPGGWRAAVTPIHQAWDATFEFPHHAHDSVLQLAGDAGPAAWVALAWAVVLVLRQRRSWALPLGAGLAAGGWSQDWFGDLEAVRAAGVWMILAGREGGNPDVVDGDGGAGTGATAR